jgi:hypothetical protein
LLVEQNAGAALQVSDCTSVLETGRSGRHIRAWPENSHHGRASARREGFLRARQFVTDSVEKIVEIIDES